MAARALLVSLAVLLAAFPAHACTICDSSTGREVRAGLFDGHFFHQLVLVALPFPVFAALVLFVHFRLPLRPANP